MKYVRGLWHHQWRFILGCLALEVGMSAGLALTSLPEWANHLIVISIGFCIGMIIADLEELYGLNEDLQAILLQQAEIEALISAIQERRRQIEAALAQLNEGGE